MRAHQVQLQRIDLLDADRLTGELAETRVHAVNGRLRLRSALDQVRTRADPGARRLGDLQRRVGRVDRLQLVQGQFAGL